MHVSGFFFSRLPKKEIGTSVVLPERAVSSCDWAFLEVGEVKLSSVDGIKNAATFPRSNQTQQESNQSKTRDFILTLLD